MSRRQRRGIRKDRLIADLVQVRQDILGAVSALSPDQQDQVFLGTWSTRDLVAHLIGWDYTNLKAVQELLSGKLPSFFAHYDRNWRTYNAQLVKKYKKGTVTKLLSSAAQSHRKLVAFLQTVPENDFDQDRGVRWKGYKETIASLLQVEIKDEQAHYHQINKFASQAKAARRKARIPNST